MCNCEMSNELIQANDSIILKLNGIENGIEDYWKRSEQKLLQKQQFEQYRWSMKNVLAHYQKIYTVLNKNNSPQLNIVERIVPTTVNFNTDSTIRDTTIPIEINQWRNFKRLVDENCFWVSSPIYKEDIVDGTQVVFEGYTPLGNKCTAKSYHITICTAPLKNRTILQ